MRAANRALLLAFALLAASITGYLRFAPLFFAGTDSRTTELPFGFRSTVGDYQLANGFWQAADPAARRIAERTVTSSVLDGTALVWLEADYMANDQPDRGTLISKASQKLGWRDPQVQRLAYNRYFEAGAYGPAIDRADALLRQDMAKDELYPHMIGMLADREYAEAVANKLVTGVPWANGFLRTVFENGSNDEILGLLQALDTRGETDRYNRQAFDAAIQRQDDTLVSRLAAKTVPPSGFIPPYSVNRRDGKPGPYVWSFGQGMSTGTDGRLRASMLARGQSSSVVLALLPGQYALKGDIGAFEHLHWKWSLRCYGSKAQIVVTQTIRIDADCPVQTLRLQPLGNDPPDLGPITLERM